MLKLKHESLTRSNFVVGTPVNLYKFKFERELLVNRHVFSVNKYFEVSVAKEV